MACGILVPRLGIEPMSPAVEARSPNHWTIREVPKMENFIQAKFEDYNPGRASQKALRTVLLEVKAQLYKFLEKEGCTSNGI